MSTLGELKTKNSGDLPTLWKIYKSESPYYENWFFIVSFLLSFTLVFISYFSGNGLYDQIQFLATSTVSVLPNLLGFSLGAYILVVGFGSTDILSKMIKPLKSQKGYSFYQKLNSVFGITVIFEVSALLFAFIVTYSSKAFPVLDTSNAVILGLVDVLNILVLFTLLFFAIYSIAMLINITKQVFIFAQTIHFSITLNAISEDPSQDSIDEASESSENK